MAKKSRSQFTASLQHEKQLTINGYRYIAGVDEAGRGPLAGPVYAAACILPTGIIFKGLNDSKKLSAEQRESIYQKLINAEGLIFGIGIANRKEIDQMNIFHATMLAMQRAIQNLYQKPDYLLIDGNQAPKLEIPTQTIVDGDRLSASIAAASIIAKVSRDHYMFEIDHHWPQYGFAKHKGYCTKEHIQAIEKWGPCPEHRLSFSPFKSKNKSTEN